VWGVCLCRCLVPLVGVTLCGEEMKDEDRRSSECRMRPFSECSFCFSRIFASEAKRERERKRESEKEGAFRVLLLFESSSMFHFEKPLVLHGTRYSFIKYKVFF